MYTSNLSRPVYSSNHQGDFMPKESCFSKWESLLHTDEDVIPLVKALKTVYSQEVFLSTLDCFVIASHYFRGNKQSVEQYETELDQHIQYRLEEFRMGFMNERMSELDALTAPRRQYRAKSLTGGANTHKQNCLVRELKQELPLIWSWNNTLANVMLKIAKLYSEFHSVGDPGGHLHFWLNTHFAELWNEIRAVARQCAKGLEDIDDLSDVARAHKQQVVFLKIRKEKPSLANVETISDMPDHIKKNISANGSNAARSARLDALKEEFRRGMILQRRMSMKIKEAMTFVMKTRIALSNPNAIAEGSPIYDEGMTSNCTPCA